MGTPPAEIEIDEALVARLLAEQQPDLTSLPLRHVDAGWDNAIFRLGDDLAVRLPRRAVAAPLIINEQTWLPRLADQLLLPAPIPRRAGMPGRGYPWRWSIVPWLPGKPADTEGLDAGQARRFGAFLRGLHAPAPADAPVNPMRSVPLRERANAVFEARIERLSQKTDAVEPAIRHIWDAAVGAPMDAPRTWLHGDLHPRNVLTDQGIITGIIDWGDITAGDCAVDLASIWMLFADAQARRDAFDSYGIVSQATKLRAQGWAILFGVILLETGLIDNAIHAAIGRQTLQRLAESAE